MQVQDRILTADIETVGLLDDMTENKIQDIHIIHAKDYETGELFTFFDDFENRVNAEWLDDYEQDFKAGNIEDGIKFLRDCKVLIMHNVSGFDALAMEKVAGFNRDHFSLSGSSVFPYKTCDTLVMSYLLNPERKVPFMANKLGYKKIGAHSIAAYGVLMQRYKPVHEDWTRLSKAMIHRCSEDVEIGEFTFKYLMREWKEQESRKNITTGFDIKDAYLCELRMAFTVARQAQRGFAFDVQYAGELIEELDEKIDKTEKLFRPHMPLRLKKKKITDAQLKKNCEMLSSLGINPDDYKTCLHRNSSVSYASTYWDVVTKKGMYKKNVTKYIPEARGYMQDYENAPVQGAITPLVWEEVPLGNRDAVKQILYKYGWRGVNYNDTELDCLEDTGELPHPWSGKIDDDSIHKWKESGIEIPDWCSGIVDWYILKSRRNQLLNKKDVEFFMLNKHWPKQANGKQECRGILPKARCKTHGKYYLKTAQEFFAERLCWPTDAEWRVPAQAFSDATNTHRMRHRVVVNIPARGLYGKEMRKCFIAAPGKQILGVDGAGLELRMLAHFMNNEEYIHTVLHGDIHTYNQNMAGLATRDMAKKFIYMFLYGSGIPNLARQMGTSEEVMRACVKKFKEALPDLDNLITRVQNAASKFGYLLSVDGRWGRIRKREGKLALNTALNVLLQMTGSIVMKWGHCIAEDLLVQKEYLKDVSEMPIVAHVHDEAQFEIETSEVLTMPYKIKKEDWKQEEKRMHVDKDNRIWSAPVIIDETEQEYYLERKYHIIGDMYCKALKLAGEKFKLRCPTAGEYKIGNNWKETH